MKRKNRACPLDLFLWSFLRVSAEVFKNGSTEVILPENIATLFLHAFHLN